MEVGGPPGSTSTVANSITLARHSVQAISLLLLNFEKCLAKLKVVFILSKSRARDLIRKELLHVVHLCSNTEVGYLMLMQNIDTMLGEN